MNDDFSRVLSQQIEYFSSDPNADRINRLKGERSQVRNVMIENIDKVLDRGDRLELLVDNIATMQGNTLRFRKQARHFRNNVWWRNVKLTIALIFLLLCMLNSSASYLLDMPEEAVDFMVLIPWYLFCCSNYHNVAPKRKYIAFVSTEAIEGTHAWY
ncbi:hypothetical protein SASPL_145311 [Salvia splendens]|uniref:V-SNARE coiled-coil homology domain-containing protein n=1 Tax=Salvia splendens TaxID=180675 RepID=A0A8X8Z7J9_SALSN|nr:vesicle-associated membrane protein 711-like [Salvia splendens]KAG6394721.1 hypothetical protein SASPL_145311 [Salvia splendens]